jgi:hypothetical protein
MTRKRQIAFALTVPFLLWLVPWLLVAFSGRSCDPGPPQTTWQCGFLWFSLSLFEIPFGWILGFFVGHSGTLGFLSKNTSAAFVIVPIFLFVYLFWAVAAYLALRLFDQIGKRILRSSFVEAGR